MPDPQPGMNDSEFIRLLAEALNLPAPTESEIRSLRAQASNRPLQSLVRSEVVPLSPTQLDEDRELRRAKLRMILNRQDDLKLLDMADLFLTAHIQKPGRSPAGQALAEAEAQKTLLRIADELALTTGLKNVRIRDEALRWEAPKEQRVVIDVTPWSDRIRPEARGPIGCLLLLIVGFVTLGVFISIGERVDHNYAFFWVPYVALIIGFYACKIIWDWSEP